MEALWIFICIVIVIIIVGFLLLVLAIVVGVAWACVSACKACLKHCAKHCCTGNERTETQQRSAHTQADVAEFQSTSDAVATPSVRPEELELQVGRLPLEPTAPSVPIDIHIPTIQPRPRTVSDSDDPVEIESLLHTPTTGEPPPAYYTVFMAEHKQLPPEHLPYTEENATTSPEYC